MSEEPEVSSPPTGRSGLQTVLLVVAGIYVVLSLYLIYDLRTRIHSVEEKQAAAEKKLEEQISATRHEVKRSTEALSSQTQQEIAERAAELQRQQRISESRLTKAQEQSAQQLAGEVAGVKTEVGGVKTDVGGVKTDVASTRSDLEATKAKLERAIGDLGIQSGLIARTADELEALKRKGDRNYYDFTLAKSKNTTPVGTISLRLKKSDKKRGKFTLDVVADDRTIEKKDRTVNEPLQFYSGKDRQLYEVVVFNVDKDRVTGYLSTPKK